MSGGLKCMPNARDMLKEVLLFINAAESDECEHLAQNGRALLKSLRVHIAKVWHTNEDVRNFDAIFKQCGWDGQGFRWCIDNERTDECVRVMELCIVEFDDDGNKTWHKI